MRPRRVAMATFLLLSAVLLPCARAAVMGIDLGSEYMKVSLIKPGTMMDIVTNVHSKRKTETMVSFYQGERSYGADAYNLLSRRPEVTYARLPTLLGRKAEHPAVAMLQSAYFPNKVSYNESKGGLTVDEAYTPEELVAMVLTHAKDITKAYGGAPVRDAVLIVPSFFTQPEKQALMDAAEIADVKVLSLMDENTAAALLYGVDNLHETPTNIVFYNLGASSLQVSVVQYTAVQGPGNKKIGQLEVKGKEWDAHLGGFQFDLRLAEVLADRFNHKWATKGGKGKDVRAFPKAMAKLRAQAKKVKEVLSANSFIPVNVEAVHNDIDLSTQVSRAEFEDRCSDLFDRAVAPLERLLQKTNMTLDDITAVEVLGGGIRVPKLQARLKQFLGKRLDLSMHLNGDEAMAQGAAFVAANISTSFRVRPIRVADVLPFAVGVRLEEAPAEEKGLGAGLLKTLGLKNKKQGGEEAQGWHKRNTVFGPNHKLQANRTISFNHSKDVLVNLTYEGGLPEGAQSTIALYEVRGVEAFAKEVGSKSPYPPKVFLKFEVDSSGMVRLVDAWAKLTEAEPNETTEAAPEEDGNVSDGKESSSSSDDEGAKAPPPNSSNNQTAEGNSTANATAPAKPKPKTHKRALTFTASYSGLELRPASEEEKGHSKKKLAHLRREDQIRQEKAEARNALEGYLYDVQNKMSDLEEQVNQVSTEEQRSAVLSAVSSAEDWMYDQGPEVAAQVYRDKHYEVKKLAGPIFLRVKEGPQGERERAMEAGKAEAKDVGAVVKKWEEVTMKWLTEEDKKPVLEELDKVEKWLAEKEEEQAKRAPHEDPAYLSTEVSPQFKRLRDIVRRTSRKPRPLPPKPKPNKTASANTTAEDGSSPPPAEEGTPLPDDANNDNNDKSNEEGGAESEEGEAAGDSSGEGSGDFGDSGAEGEEKMDDEL